MDRELPFKTCCHLPLWGRFGGGRRKGCETARMNPYSGVGSIGDRCGVLTGPKIGDSVNQEPRDGTRPRHHRTRGPRGPLRACLPWRVRSPAASSWVTRRVHSQSRYPRACRASSCSLPIATCPPSPSFSPSSRWVTNRRSRKRVYFSTRSGRSSCRLCWVKGSLRRS